MRTQEEITGDSRLTVVKKGVDGGAGYFRCGRRMADAVNVVWSTGGGWDHVSVSHYDKCPTWDEMCAVKNAFFRDDECCVEYHPKKSDYVNLHPYCLHIWRKQDEEYTMPPKIFV